MFYEKRLGSLTELMTEATTLDADAGLRILGNYEGTTCYVFVTRFGGRFTAMIYQRDSARRAKAGRKLAVLELDGVKELESLVRRVTSGKVTAFTY